MESQTFADLSPAYEGEVSRMNDALITSDDLVAAEKIKEKPPDPRTLLLTHVNCLR